MKLEVKDFLDNVKTGAMFSEVDSDNNGLSSMLRNIKTSQSMDTEGMEVVVELFLALHWLLHT